MNCTNKFFYLSFVIICITFLAACTLRAQRKYNFEQISVPDGLSSTSVLDIVQDKYGFLWIATSDGLDRYDGYNFKVFRNIPGDPGSLPSNYARSLMIDKNGTLWVGTGGGLCKYDRDSETFENFLPDSTNSASMVKYYSVCISGQQKQNMG